MNENFSTFDIKSLLDIKIDRLKDWMNRGFISPSVQRAKGQGTKNLFSRSDLYVIMLFKKFLDIGLPREQAAEELRSFLSYIKIVHGNEAGGIWSKVDEFSYILFAKREVEYSTAPKKRFKSFSAAIREGLKTPPGTYILSDAWFETRSLKDILTSKGKYPGGTIDFDNALIVNFKKIVETVNLAIRNA